jgi:hypothetical protein
MALLARSPTERFAWSRPSTLRGQHFRNYSSRTRSWERSGGLGGRLATLSRDAGYRPQIPVMLSARTPAPGSVLGGRERRVNRARNNVQACGAAPAATITSILATKGPNPQPYTPERPDHGKRGKEGFRRRRIRNGPVDDTATNLDQCRYHARTRSYSLAAPSYGEVKGLLERSRAKRRVCPLLGVRQSRAPVKPSIRRLARQILCCPCAATPLRSTFVATL